MGDDAEEKKEEEGWSGERQPLLPAMKQAVQRLGRTCLAAGLCRLPLAFGAPAFLLLMPMCTSHLWLLQMME